MFELAPVALALVLVGNPQESGVPRTLIFKYSGTCEEPGGGFAVPLAYVKDGELVDAPNGFAETGPDGGPVPVSEFRADKEYFAYGADGRTLGDICFRETVVTDRSYGSVDQSRVTLRNVTERCDEPWTKGVISSARLRETAPLGAGFKERLARDAPSRFDAYVRNKTTDAKVRSLIAGRGPKPEPGWTRQVAAKGYRVWSLGRQLPIVVAEALYVDETPVPSAGSSFPSVGQRRAVAALAAWTVVDSRWQLIFDEFFVGEHWGVGSPLTSFEAVADLDGDGMAEVVGHDCGGCDFVFRYGAKRLVRAVTSCNGYVTE